MTLSRWEQRWAEVIGRTVIPKGVCGGTMDSLSAGDRFADEVGGYAWYVTLLLRVGLVMLWMAPPFVLGRWCTLGGLAQADREQVIEKLLSHPNYTLRMLATVVKITVCTVLLGEPSLMVHLNAYGLAETPIPARPPEAERVAL